MLKVQTYHFISQLMYIATLFCCDSPPEPESSTMISVGQFAREVGVPVGYIRNVPYQPTVFTVSYFNTKMLLQFF